MTDFAVRHIGPTTAEQRHMLGSLGYSSLDELTTAALPEGTPPAELDLPDPLTETQALAELRRMAGRNQVLTSMIGLGYHDTITPAVIRRNVLENPAWYTAYTPYQPEISQGRLEALLNFQTMIADLTGLPWAGASLLDEATAAAEAMTLARRATRKGHVFLADADCLPQTLAVLRTRAEPLGIHLVVEPVTAEAIARTDDLFGVLLQFPGASGVIRDPAPLIEAAHARGALAAVAADPLALTLLRPPGEAGADVAVGLHPAVRRAAVVRRPARGLYRGQRRAQAPAAGPPGRRVGGRRRRPAYRLALQAREQHIRREKATSNICTAQVLLAVTAAMYAAYHGPDGLAAIARGAHRSAAVLAATLRDFGHRTGAGDFFDTIRIHFAGGRDEAAHALERARVAGYNLYLAQDDALQVSCDETTTGERLRELVAALCFVEDPADVELAEPSGAGAGLPGGLAPHLGVPHPPGLPRASQRDRDAALPAAAFRLRHRPRPVDDPARLVHDEAQRGGRDGTGQLAGVRTCAPARAGRAGGRLPGADRVARAPAGQAHRLRRGLGPAERRLPGRAAACSPSAATTPRAARRAVTSA